MFGRPIRGACPVSQSSDTGQVHVQIFPSMTLDPPPTSFSDDKAHYTLSGISSWYNINIDQPLNFRVSFAEGNTLPTPLAPPLSVSRWLTGHGQERGGLRVLLTNTSPSPLEIVYLESLPWFMKPYLHTLQATVQGKPIPLSTLRYRPAIDRLRGTHLEIQLTIPANTTLSLTWEFDKSILRYTEYPPDANRGFDVAYYSSLTNQANVSPAVITIVGGGVLRTPSLLLSLPTPDFSMPYNVIILSSTVIALAFGSVFNLVVRRFVVLTPGEMAMRNKFRGLILRIIAIIRARIEAAKNQPATTAVADATAALDDRDKDNKVEK